MAAPTAATLGLTLNDTVATLGLLANAGIKGSEAGTGLKTGLQRLQIAASGADGKLLGITRGSKMLTTAMKELGAEVLGAAIATFISYALMFLFIKIKNKWWMPLPILNLRISLYMVCTLGALLFRYYSYNSLLMILIFAVYTIATIQLLNHIKQSIND
mgnify:CR=1 FL=1